MAMAAAWRSSSMEMPLITLENVDGPVERDRERDIPERESLPRLKVDDFKTWIWLQQAIHPELGIERRWIAPWKPPSITRWMEERKQRRKEEARLQKAEAHAAVSVARVAAVLAAAAADDAERSQSSSSKEAALASAAALVAAQCARAASAYGARRKHISDLWAGPTDATDILMLTAAAATSLRGAATLRGRSRYKSSLKNTISTEESEFDFEKSIESLAKGDEQDVMMRDGIFRRRFVSIFLNKEAKVVVRVKKMNSFMAFSNGKERFLYSLENSGEEESSCIIVMATDHGRIEVKVKDYVCYKMWLMSISHMLKLSATLNNDERLF